MTRDLQSESALKAWAFLIVLAIVWGSSFILIKRGLEVFSPGEVGAFRIVAAGVFLLPLSLPRLKSLNKKQVKNLIIVGFVGSFIPAFLFAKAQTQLSSSLTGVFNAMTPLFVVVIGALFFNSRITKRNGIGLFIAFIGVVLLLIVKEGSGFGTFSDINVYAFFVLLACACYGLNLNIIKFKFVELKPVAITAISLTLVLPLALIYLFAFTQFSFKLLHVEGAGIAAGYIGILGVVGTALALILFNVMVKVATPVFASSVTYLIPIVAIMWGVWDGEVLLLGHYIGIAAVIFGVWVGNRR
ncbi:Permease of the drug/metabolite transporter (DMT) superfamily [Indibacter alkaliphilus LW1]|jgi:drug/metabolite transporter (DMT)-like permease|uniref:Permease of the drug/metabolite transporter (DMT) superfamily n=1 Tax=Indibacter alkaliphilus (strain CCUG 57479 / KCTC 22604 / LW1) TaxID=1189612 RepID=S2DHB5_INDAL|nr:DMT family transporter [Indibacter alkaliphilus]EOZ96515.1 Permease of the drug/metabolite transporter (DMT) superfamily [Indibacter alkaliphilus LW1]